MASVSASVSTSYSASLSPNVLTPALAFTSANVRIGVSISIFSLAEVEAKALVHTLADRLTRGGERDTWQHSRRAEGQGAGHQTDYQASRSVGRDTRPHTR